MLGLVAQPVRGVEIIPTGQIVHRVQSMQTPDTAATTTFLEPRLNLELFVDWPRKGTLYADLHYSDRATQYERGVEPERTLRLNTLELRFRDVYEGIGLKLGKPSLPYATQHLIRSEGGRAQNNLLIGNPMPDLGTPEPGMVFFAELDLVSFEFGYTSGSPTADVKQFRQFAWSGTVWRELTPRLSASFSFYNADHRRGETTTDFFQPRYDPYRGFDSSLIPDRATPNGDTVATRAMYAEQWDLVYRRSWGELLLGIGEFNSHRGRDDSKKPTTFKGDYYLGEISVYLGEEFYLAGRWGLVEFSRWRTANRNPSVDRIQYGVGYRGWHGFQPKLEYVRQRVDEPLGEQNVTDEFEGILGEVSVEF